MRALIALLVAPLIACGSERSSEGAGEAAPAAHEAHADSTARVSLSEAAHAAAGIVVEPARSESPEQSLEVPGQIAFDPRRVALVTARSAGRVEHLEVVEGDRVQAGQTLGRLYSPAFQTAQTDVVLAARRARSLDGTPDAAGTLEILNAARRRLSLLGVSPGELDRLAQGGEPADFLELTAPFNGSIVTAGVLAGQAVEPGTVIFRMADLSVVDAIAQIPERALPLVRVDQAATVTIAAYPDVQFAGHVERLHDELDQQTRTLGAVIHVPNPQRRLRPGMFATVRFQVKGGTSAGAATANVVTIPDAAVVVDGDARYVFVEASPRTYERRALTIARRAAGSATGTRVVVQQGLEAGERVVVRGVFTLKSELAKSAFAEDGH